MEGVRILESRHMVSILLFLRGSGPVQKMEIYENVSTNPRIPDKLKVMEDAGLLTETTDGRTKTITLTEKGLRVATILEKLDEVIGEV